jgi:hypothetical protein
MVRETVRSVAAIAALAEGYGQRCGGPVILAGLVVGLGVVQLASGPLAQTSRFSLELLILLVLQLVGPMLVALVSLALLLPRWLERQTAPERAIQPACIAAAALVGALLQLLFFSAAATGGVLGTPRTDLVGEIRDLLGGVAIGDIGRACLRAGVFVAAICGWSQWRCRLAMKKGREFARLASDQLGEGFILLLALKLLWISLIDPLHLSASPQ